MSRVGKRLIKIPEAVSYSFQEQLFEVKGPLGKLAMQISPLITLSEENAFLVTKRLNEAKHTKQLHGTTNALVHNLVKGVSEGYTKTLLVSGVGFRVTLKKDTLELILGYSHPVIFKIPPNLKVSLPKPLQINIFGIDKAVVGQFAAEIRFAKRASVYSGKGIVYSDEKVRRKEGKKASK